MDSRSPVPDRVPAVLVAVALGFGLLSDSSWLWALLVLVAQDLGRAAAMAARGFIDAEALVCLLGLKGRREWAPRDAQREDAHDAWVILAGWLAALVATVALHRLEPAAAKHGVFLLLLDQFGMQVMHRLFQIIAPLHRRIVWPLLVVLLAAVPVGLRIRDLVSGTGETALLSVSVSILILGAVLVSQWRLARQLDRLLASGLTPGRPRSELAGGLTAMALDEQATALGLKPLEPETVKFIWFADVSEHHTLRLKVATALICVAELAIGIAISW